MLFVDLLRKSPFPVALDCVCSRACEEGVFVAFFCVSSSFEPVLPRFGRLEGCFCADFAENGPFLALFCSFLHFFAEFCKNKLDVREKKE